MSAEDKPPVFSKTTPEWGPPIPHGTADDFPETPTARADLSVQFSRAKIQVSHEIDKTKKRSYVGSVLSLASGAVGGLAVNYFSSKVSIVLFALFIGILGATIGSYLAWGYRRGEKEHLERLGKILTYDKSSGSTILPDSNVEEP